MEKLKLFEPLGTNVKVVDLIVPFLDNKTILILVTTFKKCKKQRKVVVKRKFKNEISLYLNHKRLKTISSEI